MQLIDMCRCKHFCCRVGLDKPPKASKRQAPSGTTHGTETSQLTLKASIAGRGRGQGRPSKIEKETATSCRKSHEKDNGKNNGPYEHGDDCAKNTRESSTSSASDYELDSLDGLLSPSLSAILDDVFYDPKNDTEKMATARSGKEAHTSKADTNTTTEAGKIKSATDHLRSDMNNKDPLDLGLDEMDEPASQSFSEFDFFIDQIETPPPLNVEGKSDYGKDIFADTFVLGATNGLDPDQNQNQNENENENVSAGCSNDGGICGQKRGRDVHDHDDAMLAEKRPRVMNDYECVIEPPELDNLVSSSELQLQTSPSSSSLTFGEAIMTGTENAPDFEKKKKKGWEDIDPALLDEFKDIVNFF